MDHTFGVISKYTLLTPDLPVFPSMLSCRVLLLKCIFRSLTDFINFCSANMCVYFKFLFDYWFTYVHFFVCLCAYMLSFPLTWTSGVTLLWKTGHWRTVSQQPDHYWQSLLNPKQAQGCRGHRESGIIVLALLQMRTLENIQITILGKGGRRPKKGHTVNITNPWPSDVGHYKKDK